MQPLCLGSGRMSWSGLFGQAVGRYGLSWHPTDKRMSAIAPYPPCGRRLRIFVPLHFMRALQALPNDMIVDGMDIQSRHARQKGDLRFQTCHVDTPV